MKNFLLAISVATAALATFAGCTKEYVTNEYITHLPGVTYTVVVKTAAWQETSAGSGVFFADLDFPDLDADYFRYGSVQVAIQFGNSRRYDIVPATIDDVHYSVGYVLEKVTLYAEDRLIPPLPPGDMTVKITLTDANNGGG